MRKKGTVRSLSFVGTRGQERLAWGTGGRRAESHARLVSSPMSGIEHVSQGQIILLQDNPPKNGACSALAALVAIMRDR